MQQNQLMKKTAIYTTLFAIVAMAMMIFYSANKVVVVTGVAQDEVVHSMGTAKQEETPESIQDMNRISFDQTGQEMDYFCIPLHSCVTAEKVTIENHYMDKELWVSIKQDEKDDSCEEFYRSTSVYGKRDAVIDGYFEEGDEIFWLKFKLNDIYEYSSIFENNNLYIEFKMPKEVYDRIVIIDPAYGGEEIGATTVEAVGKEITLEIARAVKEKLDTTDIKVYYTRMNDTNPSADNRVDLTNAVKADMLIRIEVNESQDKKLFGTEAVYNSRYFIPEFGSVELADLLEREVVTAISGKANGLIESTESDEVLNRIEVPAATVRVGYITHEQEALLLQRKDYAEKIAEGIYQAIMRAYEEYL